jgi:hypothetical protein
MEMRPNSKERAAACEQPRLNLAKRNYREMQRVQLLRTSCKAFHNLSQEVEEGKGKNLVGSI